MIDLLLPSTDGGVAVQVALLAVTGPAAIALSWRNRDVRTFVIGVVVIIAAWMALRTVH